MNNSTTTTVRLARALGAGVALACLGVGTVGVGTAGAAGMNHPSSRGGDDEVISVGSCSSGARWKLKVKPDDGRLEVEGEVDSSVAGQRWRWTLRHNGSVTDRGYGTTTGRSGSFDVERMLVDIAGTDSLRFRAVHNGQVCRGVVNY